MWQLKAFNRGRNFGDGQAGQQHKGATGRMLNPAAARQTRPLQENCLVTRWLVCPS